ncbi:MAG: hypothetical protein WD645_02160, partial [Dehalococcoidia bacterium]
VVGILDAGAGHLGLLAGGDILDAQSDTVGVVANGFADPTGDARVVNLNSTELRLEADGDIGAAGNPLDIEVDVLSALAAANMYLYESDTLTVGTVTPVPVSRVNLDSTNTAIEEPGDLIGLEGTAGVVKLETLAGALSINEPVGAGADILLAAGGAGSDLTINAPVTSTGAGHLTLLAQNDFIQDANATTQGGTLFARAVDGSLTMDPAAATSSSNGGNIRYEAEVDIVVGILDAGAGHLGLLAGGNILDAQSDTVAVDGEGFASQTGDARVVNLVGMELRLEVGGDIGAAGNPLDTEVDLLSAQAGGNLYLYESNALTVGTVAPVEVTRVNLDSTNTTIEEPGDLIGLEGMAGVVKLETIDGSLTIEDPVTSGSDILLAAGGAGSDLTANAMVASTGAGHLTLLAQNDFIQAANATTQGGTLFARAVDGSVTMDPAATSTSNGGNIRYEAEVDIVVGILDAGAGDLGLLAGGDILDAQSDTVGVDGNGFADPTGDAR